MQFNEQQLRGEMTLFLMEQIETKSVHLKPIEDFSLDLKAILTDIDVSMRDRFMARALFNYMELLKMPRVTGMFVPVVNKKILKKPIPEHYVSSSRYRLSKSKFDELSEKTLFSGFQHVRLWAKDFFIHEGGVINANKGTVGDLIHELSSEARLTPNSVRNLLFKPIWK